MNRSCRACCLRRAGSSCGRPSLPQVAHCDTPRSALTPSLTGERSSQHGRSRGNVGATVREPREGAHSGSAASVLLVTGAFALAATAILLGLACLQAQLVVA